MYLAFLVMLERAESCIAFEIGRRRRNDWQGMQTFIPFARASLECLIVDRHLYILGVRAWHKPGNVEPPASEEPCHT